uniref:Transposase (Putative), gypsy type n=1 Tax=Tanacetum cinerariifolium TaxID=118510 RepID=A0A699HTM7_TANCI|nr:hypothetical protein [Tanacetum cinerariifolium]
MKTPLVLPWERIPRLDSGALDFRNLRREARLLVWAYQITSTNSNQWCLSLIQMYGHIRKYYHHTAVTDCLPIAATLGCGASATLGHDPNNRFFWVDERVFSAVVDWRTNASKDGMPAESTYSIEAVRTLDTHRTSIQKQPEMLLCLVRISRRYYLGDEVYLTFLYEDDQGGYRPIQFDLCPNPTKVKTGIRPRAPHEVPLLTLTATRVIEMDDPTAATDSSEMPPSEDVPATDAPVAGQAKEATATDPPAALESRSSHGGKSLAAIQLGLASTVSVPEDAPTGVSDSDPLSFADLSSRPPADVSQSSQGTAAAGDPESENASSPAEVGSSESVYRPEWLAATKEFKLGSWKKNLESLLKTEADMKKAVEDKSAGLIQELEDMRAQFSDLLVSNEHLSQQVATLQEQVSGEEKLKAVFEEFKRYKDDRVEQRCVELVARPNALSIDFDEELYPHMLTAIASRRWVIGYGLCLSVMKCGESLEMRQAFADVVSAGIAKGMSEGLRHGVEHGQAQLNVESIEAYVRKAEAKFVAALQALKNLNDTGDDALQYTRDLRPSSSQLTIPVYPEVRDPRNPWAYKEEMTLADAIAANISRFEKKNKCRIVCRTHGVAFAHHSRSNGVLVSVPTMVPQGLALLLADAATQTEYEDT